MDQPTSKEPRGPVSLRIKFRSASLDQFIERYAVDVSRGGIFIRTREPLPVGTQLRFDFQLQDAAPLLAGEGTIVWIRENDPARAGVTPGMGVRFDKLTPASQPVLEKILAEKTRREQAGAPAKTGPAGGMAVRRPSSTFSALAPAEQTSALPSAARAAQPVSGPPRVGGLSPLGAQPSAAAPTTGTGPLGAQPRAAASGSGSGPLSAQPRAAASAAGSGPVGAQPRTTAPAIGSDPFGTRGTSSSAPRTAENPVPAGIPTLESSGAFGRPRSTTGMNAQRPAPAPSALFEKPTADDIDRALSVLTEIDGPAPAPAPVPVDFSSRVRRPTDAQPMVVEAAPDVGDAPKAAHRRPTDAQPMVLESTAEVGEAPSRRVGTQPFFSGGATGESKLPTVPVFPLGNAAPEEALLDEEEEDDATSAWVGSGPTRVGEDEPLPAAAIPPAAKPPAFPKAPAADKAAAAKADKAENSEDALGGLDLHKPAVPPPALSLGAPAQRPAAPSAPPAIMAPDFAAPPPKKKGSGATAAIVVLVLLGGAAGGAYYVLKGPGRGLLGSAAPAPAPEVTPPAAAPEGTAQAGAAGATAAPTEPEKPAAEKHAGDTATPIYSLRLRPEGVAPKEATAEAKPAAGAEAKPAEAKPAEAKPTEAKPTESKSEGKSGSHKGKRRAAAAEAAAPEAPAAAAEKPAVADVSPTAPAEAAAAAPPSGEAAAKPAGGNHVLKISSSPAGAEVIVDGSSMGTTPFSSGDVDPALPHSITIKKDGFEAYEHMISGSDWPRAKNGVRTLKLSPKLRSTAGGDTAKPEGDTPAAEPPAGLGTTPASPKRE